MNGQWHRMPQNVKHFTLESNEISEGKASLIKYGYFLGLRLLLASHFQQLYHKFMMFKITLNRKTPKKISIVENH